MNPYEPPEYHEPDAPTPLDRILLTIEFCGNFMAVTLFIAVIGPVAFVILLSENFRPSRSSAAAILWWWLVFLLIFVLAYAGL